jgi:hypothetical protein
MSEPTPFALSHLFTQLVGREVKFALATNPQQSKGRLLFGIYTVVRTSRVIVVRADLALLAAFGGALIGLPLALGIERATEIPMDESMRDAIHEVLNIASTVIWTDGRITFKSLVILPIYCVGEAALVIDHPEHKSNFTVTIDGKNSGLFTILTRS